MQTEKSEEKEAEKPIKPMKNRVKMSAKGFNHSLGTPLGLYKGDLNLKSEYLHS